MLNTKESLVHSNRAAKMIAIYEGDKESRECIETIFSNLIGQIQDTCQNIKELHLKSHKVCPQMSHIRLINVPPSDTKLSVKGASKCPLEIVHVDTTNLYFSQNCSLCRDQANVSNIPIYNASETAGSGTHSVKKNKCHCEFDDCILVLGGNWAWIASILGYTGPNGVHFCKDCLCRLSDLQKGATHTPNPLPKYKDFVPQTNRFGVRTFQQLRADHLKYKDSGEPRSKVKNFNNCEFSSLFRGTGPVILKTSCMPLHISLGIGLKILNLIENEAVAIDCEIKTQNGEPTEEINELMENLKQLSLEISSQNDKLSYINMELEIKQSKLQEFKKGECISFT